MRFTHARSRFTSLGLLLAASPLGFAAPVTTLQAHQAVRTWLQRTPVPLRTPLAADIASIETHTDTDGRTLFHEVRLAPEGFVIVAPDDLVEPVIAFSPHGVLEKNSENHLYLMLQRDLRTRLAQTVADPGGKAAHLKLLANREAQSKWQMLMGTGSAGTAMSVATINDVRVAPLVTSKWNQSTAAGYNVYNYWTPSNYVCGCVATAMAQLMRFHSFPTTGIGAKSLQVTVDKASQTLTTRGGDALGGPYVWTSMPLTPGSSTLDSERQMIGALCYDAGLAAHMNYASDGSGASMYDATTALRTTFKYTNGIYGNNGGELTGAGLTEMVQPNLDAGFPVLFGISGDGGHAIVCDGYGYTGATTYHHLNLGWGGSSDAWYNLPNIGTSYHFNVIDDCIYNVFPSGSGEILSGRVTDASGAPLAGVEVSDGTLKATTNAKGIYALKGLTAGTTTLTATKAGSTFPQAVRVVGTSQDGPAVGNIWGVDLVQGAGATPTIYPQPQSQDVKLGGSVSFVSGATGMGPLSFQWTKAGTVVGSDPTYTLNGATDVDDQAAVVLHVTGAQGTANSAPAVLNVVRLFNGSFEKSDQGWTLVNPKDLNVVCGPTSYSEVTPHGGNGWLCIGDWTTPCTDYASQTIDIPANASAADLSLWAGVLNKSKTPTNPVNIFRVLIQDGSASTTLLTLDNRNASVDKTSGKVVWAPYGPYSLLPFRGKTVTLRLESVQAGGADTGTAFAVDDLALAITRGAKATISQMPLTLVTGGQATFTATVSGFVSDQKVNWSVDAGGGTFSPAQTLGDGAATTIFTGGLTPGAYTVKATPNEASGVPAATAVTLVAPESVTVKVTPSATAVKLGQEVTLTATVTPLTDASVDWSKSGGSFTTSGPSTATWSSPLAGPFTLSAKSHGAPSRSVDTVIQVVDTTAVAITLDQTAVTLLPGTSQLFTATGDAWGVDWTLTAPATKLDSGLSTTVTVPAAAPLTQVTYTLSAAHKLDGTRKASAVIAVKGMDLDKSGAMDPQDLLSLAAEWGKDPASPANFKGSGTVDEKDLAALLNQIK